MDAYLLCDLESTGLSPDSDPILEFACIIVDYDLNELARYEAVIRPTDQSMARLRSNPTVLRMHRRNGLYDALVSPTALSLPTLPEVEREVLALLDRTVGSDTKVTLAGSGVARYDHFAIDAQMPRLGARLTYWEQDLSSARRLYQNSTGHDIVPPKREKAHRAMSDIEDDLRHLHAFEVLYRESAVRSGSTTPLGRLLSAIAMADATLGADSESSSDDLRALLVAITQDDMAAGFIDLTLRLTQRLGSETNMSQLAVLAALRDEALDEAARA